MDDDNPPPNRPYRTRRPSSSMISSTTSPMFPAQPMAAPPPSPLAHHSRRGAHHHLTSALSSSSSSSSSSSNQVNNNLHLGHGDIDDDIQPSSSSSSFPPPRPRVSAASSSRSSGPQSPLGSPDSTFWGASPSPASNTNHNSNSNNTYRGGPATPGGMCVVSSSTVDDVPPSPFSPDDVNVIVINNNINGGGGSSSNNNNHSGNSHLLSSLASNSAASSSSSSSSSGIVSASSSNSGSSSSNSNNNPPSVVITNHGLHHHQNADLSVDNSSAAASSSSSSSSSQNHGHHHHLNISNSHNNQGLGLGTSKSVQSASSSSSSASSSFSLSPLRSKIKKASSFERFSAQAATNSGNSSSVISSNTSNSSTSNNNEASTSSSSSSSSSVNLPGPNRLLWDSVSSAASVHIPSASSTLPLSSSTPSTSKQPFSVSSNDKFHIKIPSKKLAAKLASVFEQEQLNENAAAAAAAASSSSASSILGLSNLHNSHSNQLQQSLQNQSLSQILNQNNSGVITNEDVAAAAVLVNGSQDFLMRDLSESPLNLTEGGASSMRNPVISMSSRGNTSSIGNNNSSSSNSNTSNNLNTSSNAPTKKIPLTPKQKLLHRMQSGELLESLSPPPQPQLSQLQLHHQQQQLQQHMQQSLLSSMSSQQQQQQQAQQNLSLVQDSSPSNLMVSQQAQHSPPQLEAYSYESLLRARDDFTVQDALKVTEDPNGVSILYDSDAYSYYYGNMLTDEIFSTSSRQLLMMPQSSSLQDAVDSLQSQSHGHLEFVLGLPDNEHDHDQRVREDELQLGGGNESSGSSQQQFLDPNDALNVVTGMNSMKSQSQNDSTLRNLLTNEPLRNHDDSWLALAAAEYQSRILSTELLRGGRNSSSIVGGSSSGVGNNSNLSGSSGSSLSMMGVGNSNVNSWANVNDWQPRNSWQHSLLQNQQEQVEVMDMSMMEQDKNLGMSSSNKLRMQQQQQQMHANDQHNSMDDVDLVSERDLATGLPLLSSMPMDLQQPLGLLGSSGKNSSMNSMMHDPSLDHNGNNPIDLHHRGMVGGDNEEPVNLMAAVSLDSDLVSHHSQQQQHHQQHHHQNSSDSQSTHNQHSHGGNSIIINHQLDSPSKGQGNVNNNTYTLQIQQHPGNDFSMDLPPSDNIDERRIIRVKKNKDNLINSPQNSGDHLGGSPFKNSASAPNVIMDKPVQPKSFASLPSPLSLIRLSGNGWAVFTNRNKTIPANTRFGPVEGPLKKAYAEDLSNINAVYPCLVMVDNANVLWQLDRTDDELCNWMKFVRLAHSSREQSALITEKDGLLYFTTCKEILPKTELQVGYSMEYAQTYGFPYLQPTTEDCESGHDKSMMDQDLGTIDANVSQSHINNHSASILHEVITHNNNNNHHHHHHQNDENDEDCQILENEEDVPDKVAQVMETFSCFECDQDFPTAEEVHVHLDKIHKQPEEIRRPKKKPLKKFNLLNNGYYSNGKNSVINGLSKQINKSNDKTLKKQNYFHLKDFQERKTGHSVLRNRVDEDNMDVVPDTAGFNDQPPPKVKCTMCYKSFATKDRLERHMIVHSDDDTKPLKCPFCPKRFLTNSALAGHIKTHAEEGKCFECPMCKFATQQLLQLKEHVQTHKNRENGLFYCPQCSKKFTMYSMVRKHIRAFHGPRQFTCEQCPMSFPTSDKLKLHKLKHSDHREFLCAECGRQFKRKDKLREHMKRIHETKKKSIELTIDKDKNLKKFIPKVSPEEYERFIYKCADCMLGFKRRGMLVNHLAKRHPEKPPQQVPELNMPILRPTRNYFCLYCERVYKSSSKRKAHILKGHPGKELPPQLRGKDMHLDNFDGSGNSVAIVSTLSNNSKDSTNRSTNKRSGNINSQSNSASISKNNVTTPAPPHSTTTTAIHTKDTNKCNSSSSINNVSSTSPVAESTTASVVVRREAVVGKIVANPHACEWCHRQYATRAKLLQHQRKSHLHLMPPDMQTPRTQKNNVARQQEHQFQQVDSNSVSATVSEIQTINLPEAASLVAMTNSGCTTMQALGDGIPVPEEGNVIGFLLTTTTMSANGELGNLVPSEIVMVPVQNLGGSGSTSSLLPNSINVSVHPLNSNTGSSASISSSSNNHTNPNNRSNHANINNVISNGNNTITLNVSNPILTQVD